jgi:hypothetical protein
MVDITFVCLSKSKKNHDYCIAGKVIHPDGSIGGWVRPINRFDGITDRDCVYEDQSHATSLDIVTASFIQESPKKFQTENYLIDSDEYWIKNGEYDFTQSALNKLCDKPDTLWYNNNESGGGINDQVSPEEARTIENSLYFIFVDDITIHTSRYEKLKVRGQFSYEGVVYNLKVTDIFWEKYYEDKPLGVHHLKGRYITVSLALDTFNGFHYKLIAELM